ncbi:MAG: ABC transporter permease, partial [Acidimicrobiales bacterium]
MKTQDWTAGATEAMESPPLPAGARVARARALRGARILASAASLIGLWWIGSHFYPNYVLPGPPDVWHSFVGTFSRGAWTANIGATLLHMFTAVAIILVVGLPVGIVIGRSAIAEDVSRVWLIFLQTVPTIVLIAIALTFIGASTKAV